MVDLRNPVVQRNISIISSQKRVNIDDKQICVTEIVVAHFIILWKEKLIFS